MSEDARELDIINAIRLKYRARALHVFNAANNTLRRMTRRCDPCPSLHNTPRQTHPRPPYSLDLHPSPSADRPQHIDRNLDQLVYARDHCPVRCEYITTSESSGKTSTKSGREFMTGKRAENSGWKTDRFYIYNTLAITITNWNRFRANISGTDSRHEFEPVFWACFWCRFHESVTYRLYKCIPHRHTDRISGTVSRPEKRPRFRDRFPAPLLHTSAF